MTTKPKKVDRFATFNHMADKVVCENNLSVAEFGVWSYLWRHGNADGYVTVGYAKMMKDLNIKSVSTIRKHIKRLIGAGIIGIVQKGAENHPSHKILVQKEV